MDTTAVFIGALVAVNLMFLWLVDGHLGEQNDNLRRIYKLLERKYGDEADRV